MLKGLLNLKSVWCGNLFGMVGMVIVIFMMIVLIVK